MGSLPNLHPALVHFPIALAMIVVLFDLVALARRRNWFDRTVTLLYAALSLSAVGAYLSGRNAADGLGLLPADTEALVSDHSDWALRSLLVLLVAGLLRLFIAWRYSSKLDAGKPLLKIPSMILVIIGAALILGTADRGGLLVYGKGLAVQTSESVGESAEVESLSEPANVDDMAEIERLESGEIRWRPNVESVGMSLSISNAGLWLLPDIIDDVQIEARIDISEFEGFVGLVHHFASADSYDSFVYGQNGRVELIRTEGGNKKILGAGDAVSNGSVLHLATSAVGKHFKGFVDGETRAHGHIEALEAGKVGFEFSGNGVVRLIELIVTPINE